MNTFSDMSVFVNVVDLGSFAAAARDSGLTPAAVSKRIKKLEEWLGVRLLDRTTRRLSLTEAGGRFYERCRHILEQVAESKDEASELQTTPRGNLRISAALSFSVLHLGSPISKFLTAYPEVSVDVALNDRFVDLIDEGFDVAVRIGQLEDSSLIARKLAPCRFVLCAAPAYLEHHARQERLRSLRNISAWNTHIEGARVNGGSRVPEENKSSRLTVESKPTTACFCVPHSLTVTA